MCFFKQPNSTIHLHIIVGITWGIPENLELIDTQLQSNLDNVTPSILAKRVI